MVENGDVITVKYESGCVYDAQGLYVGSWAPDSNIEVIPPKDLRTLDHRDVIDLIKAGVKPEEIINLYAAGVL